MMNKAKEILIQFLVSFFASLVVAMLIAFGFYKIFIVPNLALDLKYLPEIEANGNVQQSALDFRIYNKKKRMGFGKGEISYALFIPTKFSENKQFQIRSSNGILVVEEDPQRIQKANIEGIEYSLYLGYVNEIIHPNSYMTLISLVGDFDEREKVRIYYSFNTPLGAFPEYAWFGPGVTTDQLINYPYVEFSLANILK